jgi:hypothetical protein
MLITHTGQKDFALFASDQCPALIRADQEDSMPEALSCLGIVPHTIRGFLGRYSTVLPTGEAFSQCVACSPIVSRKPFVYHSRKYDV